MSPAWHHRLEAELLGGAPGEGVTALAHALPVVLALPLDRGRDGQVRRRIVCALLLVPREKAGVVALVSPADHQGMHVALQVAAHVQEPGSLWSAQPLV